MIVSGNFGGGNGGGESDQALFNFTQLDPGMLPLLAPLNAGALLLFMLVSNIFFPGR